MSPKSPEKPLSERTFEKLRDELSLILSSAGKAATDEKIAGYWEAGSRIATERLSEEAGYHNAILRELALDLGVSARTLQHAVLLHSAYTEPPKGPLSWAHYRLLAPLRTRKERSYYSKRALAEQWTVRDLQAALRADLYAGGELKEASIERPTTTSYIYLVENPRLIDADTFDVDIDLGFQTWTKRRLRLAHIDAPEAGSRERRAAKNYVFSQLARAQTLALHSQKVDLHGRYVADVFLSPHRTTLDDCYRNGRHLNAAIVAAGHAAAL